MEKRIHNLTYNLVMIQVALCDIEGNIRIAVDDDEIRRLGDSLKKRQIHPIIVLDDGHGRYLVIDGSKRVRAARNAGITELLAVVSKEKMTPDQVVELQLVSAFHRSDPSGYDQWQAVEAVKAAHPEMSQKQLADLLDIDAKMVKVLLSPGLVVEAARDAFRQGKIGISDCHTFSLHEGKPEEQLALLEKRLKGKSRDATARESRELRNGNGTVPSAEGGSKKTASIKIALPGDKSVLLKGATTLAEAIDLLKRATREVEDAKTRKVSPATFQAELRDRLEMAVSEKTTA